MTDAAVPEPRFRDQLAEAAYMPLRRAFCERGIAAPDIAALDSDVSYVAGRLSDALLPLIAAEVEARVQAAANQRAAEELGEALGVATTRGPLDAVAWMARRHAALASPAPAPQTGDPS